MVLMCIWKPVMCTAKMRRWISGVNRVTSGERPPIVWKCSGMPVSWPNFHSGSQNGSQSGVMSGRLAMSSPFTPRLAQRIASATDSSMS